MLLIALSIFYACMHPQPAHTQNALVLLQSHSFSTLLLLQLLYKLRHPHATSSATLHRTLPHSYIPNAHAHRHIPSTFTILYRTLSHSHVRTRFQAPTPTHHILSKLTCVTVPGPPGRTALRVSCILGRPLWERRASAHCRILGPDLKEGTHTQHSQHTTHSTHTHNCSMIECTQLFKNKVKLYVQIEEEESAHDWGNGVCEWQRTECEDDTHIVCEWQRTECEDDTHIVCEWQRTECEDACVWHY